jgi:hypothetical protein
LVEPLNPPGAEVSRFGANVCATLVSIRKTQDIPDDIDAPEGDWFVGRVGVSFSMKGMSGGPVFGFRQNAEDQWQYKPVAIQSRWFESHKLIYATPISPIMQAFEEFARRICDEEGTEEPSGHHQRESPGS